MIILDVNKLSKSFGFGELFKNVSFSLNEGEAISIIGPNGCGKSTLLKLITGEQHADSGSVFIKKGAKVAYLDQVSADKADNRMVIDILKEAFVKINNMKATLKYYENLMQNPVEDYNKTLEKYCKLVEEFSRLGGYDVDVEIGVVCSGLNIKRELFNRNYTSLSGGEKTLIQLAKVLLQKPDLLLLDEPTNHLDIERIEWLESYVKSFKGACVIVSHDRYFISTVADSVIELRNGALSSYSGGYEGYVSARQAEEAALRASEEEAERERYAREKKESYRSKKDRAAEVARRARIKQLEGDISAAEQEEAALNAELISPRAIADYKYAAEVAASLTDLRRRLDELYDEYSQFID